MYAYVSPDMFGPFDYSTFREKECHFSSLPSDHFQEPVCVCVCVCVCVHGDRRDVMVSHTINMLLHAFAVDRALTHFDRWISRTFPGL